MEAFHYGYNYIAFHCLDFYILTIHLHEMRLVLQVLNSHHRQVKLQASLTDFCKIFSTVHSESLSFRGSIFNTASSVVTRQNLSFQISKIRGFLIRFSNNGFSGIAFLKMVFYITTAIQQHK